MVRAVGPGKSCWDDGEEGYCGDDDEEAAVHCAGLGICDGC